jgi:hypothetical protein
MGMKPQTAALEPYTLTGNRTHDLLFQILYHAAIGTKLVSVIIFGSVRIVIFLAPGVDLTNQFRPKFTDKA